MKLLNHIKNRTLDQVICTLRSINEPAYFYATCEGCVTIFTTGGTFRLVFEFYTLLLKLPVLMITFLVHPSIKVDSAETGPYSYTACVHVLLQRSALCHKEGIKMRAIAHMHVYVCMSVCGHIPKILNKRV